MFTQLDAKTVEVLAELEASRYGGMLKEMLGAEREKVRDHLTHADGPTLSRLQGRAQQLDEILDLLARAQKQVRR